MPAEDAGEWERPVPADAALDGEWLAPPQEDATEDEVDAPSVLPPMDLEEPTIAHLMQRLERGLSRRQQPSEPAVAEAGELVPEPVRDHRLQSALDDLRRLARDRKSVVTGKSVSVRVDLGGRRSLNKKKTKDNLM